MNSIITINQTITKLTSLMTSGRSERILEPNLFPLLYFETRNLLKVLKTIIFVALKETRNLLKVEIFECVIRNLVTFHVCLLREQLIPQSFTTSASHLASFVPKCLFCVS